MNELKTLSIDDIDKIIGKNELTDVQCVKLLNFINNHNKTDLILYELPTIAEFISINFVQNILVSYLAHKVNKKYNRYIQRGIRRGSL